MNVWRGPATFKANCKLEIGNWPFDNQTCELGFGSHTYGVDRMNIKLFEDTSGDYTSKYIANFMIILRQAVGQHDSLQLANQPVRGQSVRQSASQSVSQSAGPSFLTFLPSVSRSVSQSVSPVSRSVGLLAHLSPSRSVK